MDRDAYMKSIMHFKIVCGASNINPQLLLYDVYVRSFDYRDIHIILYHHIKLFIFKSDDSVNE